jgi:hypothetical protein
MGYYRTGENKYLNNVTGNSVVVVPIHFSVDPIIAATISLVTIQWDFLVLLDYPPSIKDKRRKL